MKNILNHRVNLPSRLIQENWDKYYLAYNSYEKYISSKATILTYKNSNVHTTGGYQLTRRKFYNLLDKSKLATYFNNNSHRIVETKQNVILRGEYYYPGMITNYDAMILHNIIFTEIDILLNQLNTLEGTENVSLYLGAIDCLKNYLLIILNAIDLTHQRIGVNSQLEQVDYKNLCFAIQNLENFQFFTVLSGKIKWDADSIKMVKYNVFNDILKHVIEKNLMPQHRLYRKIRECNNPNKIISFAESLSKEYFTHDTLIVSFSYGGIELPFAINAMRLVKGKPQLPYIICSLSNYSTGSATFVSDLNDSLPPFYSENYFQKFSKILILDDSITTGKTIQLFLDLYPRLLESAQIGIVSFKNSNRYHHLTMPFHGGVNPLILSNSKVIFTNNYTRTYKKNSYTNKSGVFDKEKQKVLGLLKKKYKIA